jgi:adenine-specific DNA-methyltransferase
MPTLEWIGKKAVVGHHREVPFDLLKGNEELSVGESGTGNLLVQGGNNEANALINLLVLLDLRKP